MARCAMFDISKAEIILVVTLVQDREQATLTIGQESMGVVSIVKKYTMLQCNGWQQVWRSRSHYIIVRDNCGVAAISKNRANHRLQGGSWSNVRVYTR